MIPVLIIVAGAVAYFIAMRVNVAIIGFAYCALHIHTGHYCALMLGNSHD